MDNDIVDITDAVKCVACGRLHAIDSEEFMSFWGNVNVGMHGGIIGNNFADVPGKEDSPENPLVLKRILCYCARGSCLRNLLDEIEGVKVL